MQHRNKIQNATPEKEHKKQNKQTSEFTEQGLVLGFMLRVRVRVS